MSIALNETRIGRFTSSEIWQLTKTGRDGKSFGAPALSYIEEKRFERKLQRSLSTETKAREVSWGKFMERIAFYKLGWNYDLTSDQTLIHPDFDCWCGSPDGFGLDCVFDIKCPFTLKSFCQLVELGDSGIEAVRADHPSGEKYYWQLVSNAILSGRKYAELVVYVPYLEELWLIKLDAADYPDASWIYYANELELPYLIKDGDYSDLNIIRFEVPESDINRLTDCVVRASELLYL